MAHLRASVRLPGEFVKGIIFQNEAVEALLDGRKTQSRRVVKVPEYLTAFHGADLSRAWPDNTSPFGPCLKVPCIFDDTVQRLFCPYGSVGDKLYAKEPHWRWGRWEAAGRSREFVPASYPAPGVSGLAFRLEPGEREAEREEVGWHRRSPLFLSSEHSRCKLELRGAWFHRLQEISEQEALAEGFVRGRSGRVARSKGAFHLGSAWGSAREAFSELWDSVNRGRPGCSWKNNPWVVALTLQLLL